MIDEKNKIIYYDFSTGAVHQACKEKARLGNVMGWRLQRDDPKLSFGHAIHAGWAAYYDALAGGFHSDDGKWYNFSIDVPPIVHAQAAFLRDLKVNDDGSTTLPITLESEERRSIERGLALLDAYIYRWRNEPYVNILREDGSPLVEVGFQFPLAQYGEYTLVYVGYIDRIMLNSATQRPIIIEGKTTTRALSQYIEQAKPNSQITGYFKPANTIVTALGLPEIKECVWDCMFISDRKPDMSKALLDRFWAYGIDTVKDFARQTTTRSRTDVSEFLVDAEAWALDYAAWLMSGSRRWPRTAPGACHQYGGCQFRQRCSLNLDEAEEASYMATFFKVDKWEPWRKIVERNPSMLPQLESM